MKNAEKVLFLFSVRVSVLLHPYTWVAPGPRQLRYTDVGLRPWVHNVVGGSDSKSP